MGELGAALGSAAKAVGQVRAAKQNLIGSNGADQSDPGVELPAMDLPSTPSLNPGAGMSMAQPGQGADQASTGMSMSDLIGLGQQSSPTPSPAPQPPVDNPYTTDDNNQAPAANIGSEDDNPITIVGDRWTPPHKEGWLGKTIDVLEMLRGRGTPFKDRKDQENIEDAYKGFQNNPEQAISRIAKIDVPTAAKLYAQLQTDRANQALAQQRQIAIQEDGRDRLANMTGFLLQSKDPNAAYQKMLPTLRSYAKQYGLPDDTLGDTYDADQINALRSQSTSVYDQQRLGLEAAGQAQSQQYQSQELNLRKQSLGIEAYSAGTERQSANTRQQAVDEGSMAQRQAFYGRVLGGAAKVPWLYGGFMKGVFGSGSSGLPKPGTAYVSPDKSMALKLNADGSWSVYDVSKGTNHAKEVSRLPGVVAGADTSGGDFSQ